MASGAGSIVDHRTYDACLDASTVFRFWEISKD